MQVPACAPTTFPLLYDYFQLSASFSSAVLTSKNENNAKKLCNTEGEGLKFYLFQRTVVRSIFITETLWQLQVCLYYPETCLAPSIPTGRSQWGLQTGYVLIPASSFGLHRITSLPANPAVSCLTTLLSPSAHPLPEPLIAMANTGESRKLDTDSSWHLWECK